MMLALNAVACTYKDCFTCSGDPFDKKQTCQRFQECNDEGDGKCNQLFKAKDEIEVYLISGAATTKEAALIKIDLNMEPVHNLEVLGEDWAGVLTTGFLALTASAVAILF